MCLELEDLMLCDDVENDDSNNRLGREVFTK